VRLEKSARALLSPVARHPPAMDPLTPRFSTIWKPSCLRATRCRVQATDQGLEALRQRLNTRGLHPAEGFRFLKEQLRGLLEQPIHRQWPEPCWPPSGISSMSWLGLGVNGGRQGPPPWAKAGPNLGGAQRFTAV